MWVITTQQFCAQCPSAGRSGSHELEPVWRTAARWGNLEQILHDWVRPGTTTHTFTHTDIKDMSNCQSKSIPVSYHKNDFAPWFCLFSLWRFTNHLLTYLLKITWANLFNMSFRVHTIKTLFSGTFQDLQRPNSGVFQDSKTHFQDL